MYSIYADGVCIYDDVFAVESMKALNPKLTLEDSAAGSLSMTLTPANAGYSAITRLVSDISVLKDGQEIWAGRVLSEKMDFWNNRVLYCEGEFAFFNDSIQPPAEYAGSTIREFIQALVTAHNSKVAANRQFTLGVVTVNDSASPTFYTNYENTLKVLNDLIDKYGGHMRVRKENGIRYLDYLKDCPSTCTQTIQFGRNLIDFTKQWDMTEFVTAILPLGARLKDSAIEALDAYLTVEDVNDGKIYVQSDDAIATYGWIAKTIIWNDVDDPDVLLSKARAYLSEFQFDNMVIELNALDLHYLNVDTEAVKLLDEIRVISLPHGLNRLFPVTKLEIPLDSPEKTTFKLGNTFQTSLTEISNQANSEILDKIEQLPKAHSVLKEAKANATAIMNMATNGYITITKDNTGSEALIISSEKDYTRADRYWKWNMNGLAYFKRGSSGGTNLPIAITMDGSIVADFITTGTMSADRVRAGTLESTNKNVVFDLDTGKLTMKSGSIQLGEYSSGHYQFEVTEDGRLYAGASAIFAGSVQGGRLVGATGSFTGTVTAEDFINSVTGESMFDLAKRKIKSGYLDLDDLYIRLDDSVNGLSTRINLLPGEIMASVASEYVSNDGLTQRLRTSVTLDANGVLISNATGQKFTINTAENISMSFSNLTDAQTKQLEINAAQTAAGNAQATANAAQSSVSSLDIALSALKTNIGYTYINGKYVISPNIVGAKIYGGRFYDDDGKAYFEIGDNGYGDFILCNRIGSRTFEIYDWADGNVDYKTFGSVWLTWNDYYEEAHPKGVWDFSYATVKGISTTATFG